MSSPASPVRQRHRCMTGQRRARRGGRPEPHRRQAIGDQVAIRQLRVPLQRGQDLVRADVGGDHRVGRQHRLRFSSARSAARSCRLTPWRQHRGCGFAAPAGSGRRDRRPSRTGIPGAVRSGRQGWSRAVRSAPARPSRRRSCRATGRSTAPAPRSTRAAPPRPRPCQPRSPGPPPRSGRSRGRYGSARSSSEPSGCDAGNAPLAFGVARTGAPSRSANPRSSA